MTYALAEAVALLKRIDATGLLFKHHIALDAEVAGFLHRQSARVAHSKSEYKRLTAQGADVLPPKPTAVGRYIDLYREHCGTTPMLNNQECEVIRRLVEEAPRDDVEDITIPKREYNALCRDARRYRWIRLAGAWESEVGLDILSEVPANFDSSVDAAIDQSINSEGST